MSLVENIDFYKERGKYVFTDAFLRRRSYCCKSGCRHCPYGFTKMKEVDFSTYRFNITDKVRVINTDKEGEVTGRQSCLVYNLKFPGDEQTYYYSESQLEAANVQH